MVKKANRYFIFTALICILLRRKNQSSNEAKVFLNHLIASFSSEICPLNTLGRFSWNKTRQGTTSNSYLSAYSLEGEETKILFQCINWPPDVTLSHFALLVFKTLFTPIKGGATWVDRKNTSSTEIHMTRKYPLCGYILGVLTHTTAWDQHWGGDETLNWVLI